MLGNNHFGNIFAEVITIETLYASAKPLAITNCRVEFRGLYHVEISPLICRANQWTGFYMIGTSVMKELIAAITVEGEERVLILGYICSYWMLLPYLRSLFLCVSGGKKCLFFEKFGVLRFLVTPVLRFALLPYYQRYCFSFFSVITSFDTGSCILNNKNTIVHKRT